MSCSLKVQRLGENAWELLDDFTLATDKYKVTVKKGFDFDGASIPKVLWSVIGSPMEGKYVPGAVIHDGLYASGVISRNEADEVFLKLMVMANVGYVKRYAMYWAVKSCGVIAWKNNMSEFDKYKKFVDVYSIQTDRV